MERRVVFMHVLAKNTEDDVRTGVDLLVNVVSTVVDQLQKRA